MKSYFLHLGITLIIGIVVLIGYGFWYAAISQKSSVVAGLQDQISTKTETMKRIASARAALAEISGAQATLRNYFVPETGVVSFIDGLEVHGKSLGTTLSVLSVSSGDTNQQPTLTFALTIKGTFDAVMRTVGVIEYAPYDLSISQFSLVQDGKNNWHADLNLLVGSLGTVTSTSLL